MNALVCMQAKKRRLHAVPRCGSDRLKLHFREGSVADISHITKACAPREPWNICWKRRLHGVPSCGSDRLNVRIREGHMLFWYGRCQQLTPPESRKMWSFRKKSKKISCVFLLLFFYFFGKISWNFWFFGVTLGKISSRSSEPWRKNKKRKFFGLFLAGRNLWNFGATPYCKSEQTRLYHNSAKSARIGLRF